MMIQTIETSLADKRSGGALSCSFLWGFFFVVMCGMPTPSAPAQESENPLSFREYLAMLDKEIVATDREDTSTVDEEDEDWENEEVPELDDGKSNDLEEDSDDLEEDEDDEGLLGNEDDERIAEMVKGRFIMPSLAAISTATGEIGNGEVPESFRDPSVAPVFSLPESATDRAAMIGDPAWGWTNRTWAAPNTFSNPRYFEDRMLERHGHERWGCSQPLFAGARFFATIPMLPYLMAIEHPCDCESTLGYYRSGSCTPTYFQRPPWDRKALVAESVSMAAGLWILP